MKLKIFSSLMALVFLFSACSDLFDDANGNVNNGNGKVENKFGAVVKQDFNNAQFHCNAISGNGRVWPEATTLKTAAQMQTLTGEKKAEDNFKKFAGQLTFANVVGTTKWYLTKVEDKTAGDIGMVVCPICGSTQWITFSNNSGVPDGKNIQMQHPGENFTIVKDWIKNNEPYELGTKFVAEFKVTMNGNTYMVGPGNYFLPEGVTAKVEETGCTDGFALVKVSLNGAEDTPLGSVSGIVGGDVVKFINADRDTRQCDPVTVWFYPMNDGIWGFDAIVSRVYNPCNDGCFEDWVKSFEPEDFWGSQPGFDNFMCTFDRWVMVNIRNGHEELAWSCDPYIDGEPSRPGVSIFAKHGVNKCTGSITATANLLETWRTETHELVYEPIISRSNESTLVSKSPNAFGNGQTWVAVNVAEARADNFSCEIADSSPSNRGIGYSYNVKIEGNNITVYFDDNLVRANFGFEVQNTSGALAGVPSNLNHVVTSSRTLPLPAGYGDTVYLFFHNAGGIQWISGQEVVGCKLAVDGVQSGTRSFTRGLPVYKVFDAADNEVEMDNIPLGTYTVKLFVNYVQVGNPISVELTFGGQVFDVNFGNQNVETLDCVIECPRKCGNHLHP